jgi:hypothetical protein
MLHYLYAESENFYPIEKKRKILNFNKLAEGQEGIAVNCTASKTNKPWDPPFDRILARLLNKLKEYGPIDPNEDKKNRTLLTVLKFVWETLNLGFWNSKHSIKEILTDVLKILQKSDRISDYK